MAGGPIFPNSVYLGASSGNLFPNFYAGGGGNASAHDEGIGVVASLTTPNNNVASELRFKMPPTIPSGTLKLHTLALANASTGTIKFTVSDINVASSASPSAAALTAEAQQTISWSTLAADKYQENKLTLTPTPIGNDMLVMAVAMNSTGGWTMAQTVTLIHSIIWE